MVSLRRVKIVIALGIISLVLLKLHSSQRNPYLYVVKVLDFSLFTNREIEWQYLQRKRKETDQSTFARSDTTTTRHDVPGSRRGVSNVDLSTTSNPQTVVTQESDEMQHIVTEERDKMQPIVTEERDKMLPVVTEERDKMQPIVTEERNKMQPVVTQERDKMQPIVTEERDKMQPVVTEERDKMLPVVTEERDKMQPVVTEERDKMLPVVTEKRDKMQPVVTQERDKMLPVVTEERDKMQPIVTEERNKMQPVVTQERNENQFVRDNNINVTINSIRTTRTSPKNVTSNERTTTESVSPTKKYETQTGSISYTLTEGPFRTGNSCKLPKLNPWDSSIKHLLKDVGFNPKCSFRTKASLFDVIDNRLVLRNISGPRPTGVSLQYIHRVKHSDSSYSFEQESLQMNALANGGYESEKILGSDFFRISYSANQRYLGRYYHAQVVARNKIVEQSKVIRSRHNFKKGLPLNVLMLGFDSTSNANFVRKMPHTLNWLRTEKRSYAMKGYSIVGDATTPILTALLTGERESTLPEGRIGFFGSKPIDQWPWISRVYEKHGYVTLHSEDDPGMGSFNLRLMGFKEPPYHHFMRPFWLAIEDNMMRDEPGVCSDGVSLVNYTMDYLISFFDAYKDTPKFAMGFLSYLTHAHPNHLSFGDLDVLSMLQRLKSRGYLNDTLLILFGDHGSRNDDVRNTMQGKLEERLPWLSISVPDWLESNHPEVTAALANNEQIISSPFDVHTTLRHILSYPEVPEAGSYRSLFTRLPHDRTCQDAGIDEHWCPCLQFTPADTRSLTVNRSAQAVVDHINKRLTSNHRLRSSCHVMSLIKVHSVMKYEPNHKVQTFYSTNQRSYKAKPHYGPATNDDLHYLITFETSPMGALFEATVAITTRNNIVIVNPNISRINRYGDQPKCIAKTHPYLKKFCACRS